MHVYLYSKVLVAYTKTNPVALTGIPRPTSVLDILQGFLELVGVLASPGEVVEAQESGPPPKYQISRFLHLWKFSSSADVAGPGPTLCKQLR